VGLVSLFFFEIFVYYGTVVVIWVVAVAFVCCFCGWVGVQIFFGCFVFVRRGEERSSLFCLFVCGKVLLLSLVVSLGVGGFFFPSFGVKETKRKKRRRRRRRRREREYAMKASFKVRDGQKPLMRAKVPITILGLPLFSGISVGNAEELALHVGSYLEAGPSCKVSYRPHDEHSAFTLMLKTGFGLWGSPSGAALAMAAEFNLSSRGNPAFLLRVKPRIGDFSFRKDTCSSGSSSSSLNSSSSGLNSAAVVATPTVQIPSGNLPEGFGSNNSGVAALVVDNNGTMDGGGLSPLGLGVGSGLHVKERSNHHSPKHMVGTMTPDPTILTEHAHSKAMEHMGGDGVSESSDDNLVIVSSADHDSQSELALTVPQREENNDDGGWRRMSWLGDNTKSWSLGVHSVIPFGRHVVGRVRWGVRIPADIFHSFGNQESDSGCFSVRKLPVLVMDKISIETVDPFRSLLAKPSWYALEGGSLSSKYGFMEGGSTEESRQLGRIAAMCCSLRHQLHILHSENQVLKRTMDDMRVEIAHGIKRLPMKPAELLMHEENMLRSQLFDELNVKVNGSNNHLLPSSESKETSSGSGVVLRKESDGKKEIPDLGPRVELKPLTMQGNEFTSNLASSAETRTRPGAPSDRAVSEELKKAIKNATNSGSIRRID
jgi:hypothetical protein